MTKKDLQNLILRKIAVEHLEPRPRWQFVVQDYAVWLGGTLAVVVGGLALAVITYVVRTNDWDLYAESEGNFAKFLFLTLPYIWIVLLVGFVVLAEHYVRQTRHGYRLRLVYVVGLSIAASALLSVLFYRVGLARSVDVALEERLPVYSRYLSPRHAPWTHPAEGLLTGRVVAVEDATHFMLVDVEGEYWNVILDVPAAAVPLELLEVGRVVRMIGREAAADTFVVGRIRVKPEHIPLGPCGQMMPPVNAGQVFEIPCGR